MPTRLDILSHGPLRPPPPYGRASQGGHLTAPHLRRPLQGTRPDLAALPRLGAVRSSDRTDKGTGLRDTVTQETRLPRSAPAGTYLCWCRTSSSRLRPSRPLAPLPCRPGLCAGSWKALRPPLEARLEQEGRHTWRASPLILFRPRSPLVLAFFLSCCRKAFSPGGGADDRAVSGSPPQGRLGVCRPRGGGRRDPHRCEGTDGWPAFLPGLQVPSGHLPASRYSPPGAQVPSLGQRSLWGRRA